MNTLGIAVLLSAYNGERYIKEQIASILSQKLDCPLHLYIRDDGSTDSTVSLLNTYAEDPRITVFMSENLGYVASFFSLISSVRQLPDKYDYFALADQDDVWATDKLQTAIDALSRENPALPLLYGSCSQITDENLNVIGTTVKEIRHITFYNSLIQNITPGHTHVMNMAIVDLLMQNIDATQIYAHDHYIVNVAVIRGKLLFDNTPHTLYRQHSHNELGHSSNHLIPWLRARFKRIRRGEGNKYVKQIQYIISQNRSYLTPEQQQEATRFLSSRKNIFRRLTYISRTKFYRQSRLESMIFRLYYLFGGYNE